MTGSFLCMQRMCMDLKQLADKHNLKKNSKLLLSIVISLFRALRKIHDGGWIHRDLKPGNIMFSEDLSGTVYVDFGLAKKYLMRGGRHIPLIKNKNTVVGTAKYLSKWCHEHVQQSRRDDCASLMYTVSKCANGPLPWDKVGRELGVKDKLAFIYKKKCETPLSVLFQGLPPSLTAVMEKIQKLEFDQRPDYTGYQRLLLRDWKKF